MLSVARGASSGTHLLETISPGNTGYLSSFFPSTQNPGLLVADNDWLRSPNLRHQMSSESVYRQISSHPRFCPRTELNYTLLSSAYPFLLTAHDVA